MAKQKKASKLLLLLGEYLGFSLLCGWVCILFFLWTARVISNNYTLKTGISVTIQTEYWINLICIGVGIFIAIFVLVILLQKKFSYIIKISSIVEEMESGKLAQRIPIEGEDELADLALSINNLAGAMEYNIKRSEEVNQERMQTIAVLSHDLRTPLTSVMSYIQFIRDGQFADAAQLKLYADRAYEKANRIKEMSDSLFDSCISDTDIASALEKVEGGAFLENVLTEIKGILEEDGFEVRMGPPLNERNFYIMVDHAGMSRLFDNVVSNIEKYADEKYPVEFMIELTEEFVILKQSNQVPGKHRRKNVESHLLGLKSVENSLRETGGSLTVREDEDHFALEIMLPVC